MTENEDEFRKSDRLNFRLPPNLRIRGHLSAPIVGKSLKMVEFPTFVGSDLGSGHGHYFFISHRVLPVYQISSKSKKLFVDGRTAGRKFATHSIRSTSKVWKST